MDPSSTFFDGPRAYLPNFSAAREAEADAFTANLSEDLSDSQCSSRTVVQDNRAARQRASDEICIGIPSIKRNKEQFLRRTIASLFDTLESDERKTIYLAVLIADDHAEDNPAYGQDWLGCLADEIMVYSEPSLPSGLVNYRRILSPGHNHKMDRNEHVRHDYANLIEACQRRGSPFFTLIEDDTIASRSWLRRLRQGLIEAEEHNSNRDWLYIRLFYSETYLGWNNEEIPIYIRNIIFIYVSLGIILSALDFRRSLSSAGVHNGFHPQHHHKLGKPNIMPKRFPRHVKAFVKFKLGNLSGLFEAVTDKFNVSEEGLDLVFTALLAVSSPKDKDWAVILSSELWASGRNAVVFKSFQTESETKDFLQSWFVGRKGKSFFL
ncbi:hypothetical protein S7711_09128 [Stachybotrys chartarum IBT 7711]|uniref:Uncharacterized protein n=1 Tax=Stachybotrys chartarum (strain CBS 109288 / IBT 7711) TaxID=1280523 RepID=A0A084B7R3_STACB|nr:hypothetical protein S7711_09128 [Stachybotrys chartarum IBT 7711]